MTKRLAWWLRRLADRIDHAGAPKVMRWSFAFETGRGIVFREDGKGCRLLRLAHRDLAYLGDGEYEKAHSESGSGQAECEAEAMDLWYCPPFCRYTRRSCDPMLKHPCRHLGRRLARRGRP